MSTILISIKGNIFKQNILYQQHFKAARIVLQNVRDDLTLIIKVVSLTDVDSQSCVIVGLYPLPPRLQKKSSNPMAEVHMAFPLKFTCCRGVSRINQL